MTGNGGSSTYDAAKISGTGQRVWGYNNGSPPGVTSMVLDASSHVYLTGGVLDFPNNVFGTLKLDNSGNVVWQANYLGSSKGYTTENQANGISLDSWGNIYVGGVNTNNTTGNDFAILKYDPDGNQKWVIRYNGRANGNDGATAIAVAPDGSIYVTGYSENASGGTDIVTIKCAPGYPPPVQLQVSGAVLLQLPRPAGQSFNVESSTNLTSWQLLGPATADENGLLTFEDTNAAWSSPARFYRTVVP